MTFPKLIRLHKPVSPDTYGVGDSPLGSIMIAWQGDMLVRLHIVPANGETHLGALMGDWGWGFDVKRDDKRAAEWIRNKIFDKGRWTGVFPADITIGFHGSDFQWKAMQKLLKVPTGKTISYADLARASGSPGAARAAGSVCAKNPLALIVPCHRILAANGTLGGYGYGSAMKRQLLDWET